MTGPIFEDVETKAQPSVLYQSDGVVRRSVGTFCTAEEGMTRQEQVGQADIQTIVSRVMAGGLPELREGIFADVSAIPRDLHSALEQVRRATLEFNAMPPRVRNAFNNDMADFTDAFQSEEGQAKLKKLGVIPPTAEELEDRRERAIEDRAAKRIVDRERARRVAEAESDPPKFKDALGPMERQKS